MKSYVKQLFRCIKNSTIGVFFNQGNQEKHCAEFCDKINSYNEF